MDKYSFLRELADSWVLLAMTGFYLATILYVFRPGTQAIHKELSELPLRDDGILHETCADCEDCTCKKLQLEQK